jgi:hypothetical protein
MEIGKADGAEVEETDGGRQQGKGGKAEEEKSGEMEGDAQVNRRLYREYIGVDAPW